MKKDILKRQQKIAILLVLWRIPEFITSLIAACASQSMVVWLEFIENASVLIPGLILIALSSKLGKNLRFQFNYGTGKVEAITALCCEMLDIAGLFCVLFFSVRNILMREREGEFMVFALVVSIFGVVVDGIILARQKKLVESEHSKMLHTAYVSAQKEFGFDFLSIITLIIGIVFENSDWIVYFSPIVCIIAVIPFSYIVIKHLRESVHELIDETLDEESQMKIIKALNEFFDSYDELVDVKSRINGSRKIIDLELRFSPGMTYGEITKTAESMKRRISEEIGECIVNVIMK